MENPYKQIRPHRIPEEIVQQVKALIKGGKLLPGERLPAERAFAELLGVGRSSLREAISILETLGFVETRKRKGIFVRSVSSPIISDPLRQMLEEDKSGLFQLYEIRRDIESAAAYACAGLRTKSDLAAIRKPLLRMQEDVKDASISLADDWDFHLAICQATHNFIRVHILKNVFSLAEDFMNVVLRKLVDEKRSLVSVVEQHTKLFEAIVDKDQEGARALMYEHLSWVEDKWKEFGAKQD
jgi:GntR family transcriptional regulator, transcriptional repressor for pyruvate dehydrogenase complex